ncbi:MAG: ATP-binding protein [Rhodanobacter sp.]
MKVSIGKRLFFAVLLSFLVVAGIGVELVRWKLSDAASQRAGEVQDLSGLMGRLSASYRQHHDWSFLPARSDERRSWFHDQLMDAEAGQAPNLGIRPPSPTLGYRIGLLDSHRRYLAGMVASPVMIAIASIDTLQQPVVVDRAVVGYLVVAKSQNPDDELAVAFLLEQQENLLLIAAIGVLLSAFAAALLAAHFRKPIRHLLDGTRRLGQGHFDARLSTRRSDELGELAATFNQLASRLQDTERWRQQWVADTSHELRTPLSVLRAQLEALHDGIRTATPETVALLLRQVLSLTALVDDLHELACADEGQLQYDKTAVDAWQLVVEVFESFGEKFRAAQLVSSITTAPPHVLVHADANRLRQVLVNLVENSVRYTDAGGRIDISGTQVKHQLHITIDDSTPAVPAALVERLGERFFRVEPSRNRQLGGAGLGLALSRHIVEAHGGRLEFAASALGGLRVTVVLPRAP